MSKTITLLQIQALLTQPEIILTPREQEILDLVDAALPKGDWRARIKFGKI